MSQQTSQQKTDASGRLAVVGDRELVIGYRLIGIDDTFIVSNEEDASKKIQELYWWQQKQKKNIIVLNLKIKTQSFLGGKV